jgi:dipeptidyl aminopeptidase/acylaminoacyl peptidase
MKEPAPASSPTRAPHGSWKSPITSDLIVAKSIGLGQLALDGEDIYWTESRPTEGGRNVLVRRAPDGSCADITPAGFNVRTRVHEYGGGDYVVDRGTAYFSNFADQRVYRQEHGGPPRPITPEAALRYADYVVDPRRELLFCVREDKRLLESPEDVNTIVTVAATGDEKGGRVIVSGNDFYASPRPSPDGKKLAWLTWNHPEMPWDAAELWVGDLAAEGAVERKVKIAGGAGESIFQPAWGPDGTLYFVSDRTGWWNLYRSRGGVIEAIAPRSLEFGAAQWVFGMATYAFVADSRIVCTYAERGTWRLAEIDTTTLAFEPLPVPSTSISGLRGGRGFVLFAAGSPTASSSFVRLDLKTRAIDVLRRSIDRSLDPGYLSIPEPIEFPTEGGRTAHAFYYRPNNRDFVAPPGEKPPLIVKSHGGPTSATSSTLALGIQYWTSRGFAVVDVNYGGSTGYGRAYRERLKGQWGVVDVDDCVNAARYLIARGEVDAARLAITGGSAGGYTTLCALTFHDLFKAGASYYGISDLEIMAKDARTGNPHKFESRYEEGLVAPYPDGLPVYRERSPIHHTDRLSCPLIFFQGLDDRIVLPNQAERMVDVLRAKGLPVAYIPFAGEGHGFRRAENIKRALDAELYFYARVFGLDLAEPVEPVHIENMGA